LLGLSVFFMGFVVNSAQMPSGNVHIPMINGGILLMDILYKTYDQCKDDFVNCLPKDIPVDQCKQVLRAEQARLKEELDSVSYKNVFFSLKSMSKMVAFLGVAALEYTAPNIIQSMGPRGIEFAKYLDETFGPKLTAFMLYNSVKGLLALQALSGLSFARDIKEVGNKKKSISDQYDKCTKMLALLSGHGEITVAGGGARRVGI